MKQEQSLPQVDIKESGRKKSPKRMIVFLLLFAILFIGLGVFIAYLSNPKRIVATAMDQVSNRIEEFFREDSIIEGNDFNINSDIHIDIENKSLAQNSMNQNEINLFQNLKQVQHHFSMIQNTKEKKLYLDWNIKQKEQDLFYGKYFVQDATKYYYIQDFLDTYINAGNSNYFESLEEVVTAKENRRYLYDFLLQSLKNSLKEDYFMEKQETTMVDEKEQKMRKITFELSNKRMREIVAAVLADVKKDETASKILMTLYPNFKKLKVDETTMFLPNQTSFSWNVYTTKFTYQVKKYELIFIQGENQTKITLELGKEKQVANVIYNNQILYTANISSKENGYQIEVINARNGQSVGKIQIQKEKNSSLFDINIKTEKGNIEFQLTQQKKNIKQNKSYDTSVIFTGTVIRENTPIWNGKITIDSTITTDTTIEEDVRSAVLASSITQEQKDAFEQKLLNKFAGI